MSKSKGQGKKRRTAKSTTRSSSGGMRNTKGKDKRISARTKRQIDSLPEHAQHIYKKAHAGAIDQYQNPEKRRGGKRQSAEEVAHKTAWAAVKREYKKKGNQWVKKEEE
jgi:cation transport regulator